MLKPVQPQMLPHKDTANLGLLPLGVVEGELRFCMEAQHGGHLGSGDGNPTSMIICGSILRSCRYR